MNIYFFFFQVWHTGQKSLQLSKDDTYRAATNLVCYGGLIRDEDGVCQRSFSRKIDRCSMLQAEPWGALDRLQLTWHSRFCHIILEIDNVLVVQLLTEENYNTNASTALVRDIKHLILQDWHVRIQHVNREGNRCVDWLTNVGISLPMGLHSHVHVPNDLQYLFTDDIMGVCLLPPDVHDYILIVFFYFCLFLYKNNNNNLFKIKA